MFIIDLLSIGYKDKGKGYMGLNPIPKRKLYCIPSSDRYGDTTTILTMTERQLLATTMLRQAYLSLEHLA